MYARVVFSGLKKSLASRFVLKRLLRTTVRHKTGTTLCKERIMTRLTPEHPSAGEARTGNSRLTAGMIVHVDLTGSLGGEGNNKACRIFHSAVQSTNWEI